MTNGPNYRAESAWCDKYEIWCLYIFKDAEEQGFPRGFVTERCRKLAKNAPLSEGSLKAKAGNYKSEAGYTRPTNSSKATKKFYEDLGGLSAAELRAKYDFLEPSRLSN